MNMNMKQRPTVAQFLDGTGDTQLFETVLCNAFRIKTLERSKSRTEHLWNTATLNGVRMGDGKRCSLHRRCGNLACPVCRLRAQLAFMTVWSDFVRPSKQRRMAK